MQAGEADERVAFEAAMKDSWQMVDPLRPPPAGSYYAGEHAGICAALKTVRANFDRHWQARASLPTQPADQAKWCEYVAGMVDCWINSHWPNYNHMDEERRVKAIAGIIERRLWALNKQPATPPQQAAGEPVGEPSLDDDDEASLCSVIGMLDRIASGQTMTSSDKLFDASVRPRKMTIKDAQAIASPAASILRKLLNKLRDVTTHPAPGVPEGFVLVPVEPTDEMVMAGALAHQRSPCHDFIGPIGDAWVAMLAAAQSKGADHG